MIHLSAYRPAWSPPTVWSNRTLNLDICGECLEKMSATLRAKVAVTKWEVSGSQYLTHVFCDCCKCFLQMYEQKSRLSFLFELKKQMESSPEAVEGLVMASAAYPTVPAEQNTIECWDTNLAMGGFSTQLSERILTALERSGVPPRTTATSPFTRGFRSAEAKALVYSSLTSSERLDVCPACHDRMSAALLGLMRLQPVSVLGLSMPHAFCDVCRAFVQPRGPRSRLGLIVDLKPTLEALPAGLGQDVVTSIVQSTASAAAAAAAQPMAPGQNNLSAWADNLVKAGFSPALVPRVLEALRQGGVVPYASQEQNSMASLAFAFSSSPSETQSQSQSQSQSQWTMPAARMPHASSFSQSLSQPPVSASASASAAASVFFSPAQAPPPPGQMSFGMHHAACYAQSLSQPAFSPPSFGQQQQAQGQGQGQGQGPF